MLNYDKIRLPLLVLVLVNMVLTIVLGFSLNAKRVQINELENRLDQAVSQSDELWRQAVQRGYIKISQTEPLLVSDWVENPEQAKDRIAKIPTNDKDHVFHGDK